MLDPLLSFCCGDLILPSDRHYGYFFIRATSFYNSAFKDCINLSSLAFLGAVVPEIRDDIFANVSANFKILVPKRYIKNYLRIIEWQKYKYLLKPLREA